MVTELKEKIIKIVRPERLVLPGYDPDGSEKNTCYGFLAFSVFISLVFFVGRYSNAETSFTIPTMKQEKSSYGTERL